uniref:Reverse transcriptase RNase H-like domain-containing protein n=1 Tax=Amphimedon queenslandica TaxID=400682 RepID=A0A1X7TX65_AMPQE
MYGFNGRTVQPLEVAVPPGYRNSTSRSQTSSSIVGSSSGIGAVLSQLYDGKEHVVAYACRALHKAERNYSVTRKELLAIVNFTSHFCQYLLGLKFKLHTDHHSLTWLTHFKKPEGQLAHWLEKLAVYTLRFSIVLVVNILIQTLSPATLIMRL